MLNKVITKKPKFTFMSGIMNNPKADYQVANINFWLKIKKKSFQMKKKI